nr:VacJ family lipoprotein [Rhodovulum sp. P5]
MLTPRHARNGQSGRAAALFALVLLSACARPDAPAGINDPDEARNRIIHEDNVTLDRAVIRPVANAYGTVVPGPVRTGIDNFASNLGLPSAILNSLLQFRPGDAVKNTGRFVVNSTVGIGGLFDPASAMGLTEAEADFGETLYVWGVPEGEYVEHPVLGPSTTRDSVGGLVDMVLDPLGFVNAASVARNAKASAGVIKVLNFRYESEGLIDSVLYDSADSYAQSRQIYLDNRRFELGQGRDPTYFDPYEDPYDDPAFE